MQRKLRVLGLQRLAASSPCVLRRFVSLCFGFDDGLGTCVVGRRLGTGEFMEARYHRMLWTKWHVLRVASSVARLSFYIDADVVVLSNPWPALPSTQGFDLLYQAEVPAGCDRTLRHSIPRSRRSQH